MRGKIFKKGFFSLLIMLLVLTSVGVPVSASTGSPLLLSNDSSEYVVVDGEKLYLEKEISDGFSKGIVKNENGEVVSEVSINLNTNEATLDGVKLSDEEFQEIVDLGQEELIESLNPSIDSSIDLKSTPVVSKLETSKVSALASSSCTYKKIGSTKKRTTWIPKTGAAAVAAAISIAVPGVGWAAAWAIAGVVAGSSNTLYYTTTEYSCYTASDGYYHLKTSRKFYKNSNYTGHIKTVNVYGKRR